MIYRNFLLLLTAMFSIGIAQADNSYQTPEAFVSAAFSGHVPKTKIIWLTGERKETTVRILGHRYHKLRIRYWQKKHRTVWILEERGKKQLITTGLIVDAARLAQLKILVFRESRGSEIHHPFFTDQFKGMNLEQTQDIDHRIDGISGATLSVRAMKKLATLALYLDREVNHVSP